ncbi:unnamed protein product [Aureobasidium uvarum]|uniref:Uncharacterized protein n=1 Tax=Aureobasidium uvarum TaxID=2773716 RepID=A0A9N8KIY3_9PEZI|nr:unnamed protein product [Aureobasidium uvarum]
MPCRDETHEHDWPKEGTLVISKCEIFCGYCAGPDAKKPYLHPWELRGHVRDVHARDQGLPIIVSPRPPKPHVNPTTVKRKHTEVEESDSEEGEGSDNNEDESADEEEEEEDSDDNENKSSDEDDPMKGHAASFKPVGPKSGPPSAKRAKQATSMGPPPAAPMNNPAVPFPQMPMLAQQQYQAQYQQQVQGLARAASAHMNPNGQGIAGYAQQMPNNGQRPTSNMGLASGSMGPQMNPQAGHMQGQSYGRIYPVAGQPMFATQPQVQYRPVQTSSGAFYASHPDSIAQAPGPPNHQRLRNLTTHMLTHSNMSELSVINHYQQEIEYIRQLQNTRVMTTFQESMRAVMLHETTQQMRYMFANPPKEFDGLVAQSLMGILRNKGVGDLIQNPDYAQQQPGQRTFSGGQQPTTQHPAFQQPVVQQTNAEQVGPQQFLAQQPGPVKFGAQQTAPEQVTAQQPGARQLVDQPLPASSAPEKQPQKASSLLPSPMKR